MKWAHWVLAATLQVAAHGATAQVAAIVNANVVDVRATTIRQHVTVVVVAGRIARIGAADSVTVPAGAQVIDAAGGYLIPGLADMHAHFKRPEDFIVFLAYGVTLVQYLNASPEMVDWRDSIAAGRVVGPELHPCAGPIIGVDSVQQAMRIVSNAVADGFDCIKPYDRISDVAFHTLTNEGRRQHVRTVGHIPRNLTWEQDLDARPSAVAHAEEFLYSPVTSQAALDSIVQEMRDGHIALIPTLIDYDVITRQVVSLPELLAEPALSEVSPVERRLWGPRWNHYARSFRVADVPVMRRRLTFQRDLVRLSDSAGVRILAGTDEGNLFVFPGSSLHAELEQLVLSGLSPAATLRAATLAPAEFLGRDQEIGTVDEGKRADLVLVYGNPLRDITNTRLIGGVMRNGRWFPVDSLRRALDAVRKTYGVEERFLADVDTLGIRAALTKASREGYRPDQRALNELAYQFWRAQHDTASARATFLANAQLYPTSWMALGSLGEWQEFVGDFAAARRNTEAALRTHPHDRELLEQLENLRARVAKKE
jgi:hypothetical protein